jgi:hypothetical protein
VLRGDPAAGGQIDALSHTVGIVGPDAWCVDPQGVMYFFGDGVFYRLAPNSAPEPISRGRMDRTFAAIDTALNTINLMWDELLHGVHIYVTPLTTGASTHFWWDVRTDSFWKEVYPNAVGPTATLVFQSPTSTARADLLGGQDGYVREISATAKTDDGTTILSRVKFAPTTPGDVHQNSRISRITTVLESTSDPVRVSLYAAQSPEEVVAATTPAWSYMVTPQVRYSIPRIQGNSLLLEMKNDSFSTAWVTGTNYVVGSQVVASDGLPYVSLTVHTSTTGGSHPTPPGNTTDWVVTTFRTWALESANVVLDLTGRTRHGRI